MLKNFLNYTLYFVFVRRYHFILLLPWYCFVAAEGDQHWCYLHSPFWKDRAQCSKCMSLTSTQSIIAPFCQLPSYANWSFCCCGTPGCEFCCLVAVSPGEQYLFVYGGRSALQPVLGDWHFLHVPELSCTAVRMHSVGIAVRADCWTHSFSVTYSLCWAVELGRDIQRSSSPARLLETGLTRAGCSVYCPGRIISIDGDSTISLDNLLQCLTTLMEQYEGVLCLFFSMSVCAHCLLPFCGCSWEHIVCVLSPLPSLCSCELDILVEG